MDEPRDEHGNRPDRFSHANSSPKWTELLSEFEIVARAHVRLLPGKTRAGTYGMIENCCYFFAFEARTKYGNNGSLVVGEASAEQFLDLTGQAPLPCFDPLITAPPERLEREPLNEELYSVLNLLLVLVDIIPEPHFLKHFEFFNLYLEKRPFDERVRKVNHLVGTIVDGITLRQRMAAEPKLRRFEFPEINQTLFDHGLPNNIDP